MRVNPPEATQRPLVQVATKGLRCPASPTGQRPARRGNDFCQFSLPTTIYLNTAACSCYCTAGFKNDNRSRLAIAAQQHSQQQPSDDAPEAHKSSPIRFSATLASCDGGRGHCPTIQCLRGLPPLSSPTSRGASMDVILHGQPPGWAQSDIPACD
ncbi:hypothetical protein BDP81DRAFT_141539 [Colletotrichum phormii]|uniref:Uncharacterized protein n=1 Tax=Colletotrichum phormii TaxID=359342 RepID=A0AAI9ZEW6_9PEZI|nr:uncharacterized protein BDP81DRAFT_141539 [Colletotrichum phormii]KAK1622978.1 hypothetical protein BDP81DRAFT_141539 [Colletotrichum phormii]